MQQSTELDDLYGILFPKYFKDAMSSQRPAATIAELRKELAEREERINNLESSINSLKDQFKETVSELTDAVNAVEKDIFTPNNLKDAFLRFDSNMAHMLFGSVATLLTNNPTWQKYAPQIQQAIIEKQEMEKRRDVYIEEYVVNKHVENEVNGVAPGAIGIKINKDKQ